MRLPTINHLITFSFYAYLIIFQLSNPYKDGSRLFFYSPWLIWLQLEWCMGFSFRAEQVVPKLFSISFLLCVKIMIISVALYTFSNTNSSKNMLSLTKWTGKNSNWLSMTNFRMFSVYNEWSGIKWFLFGTQCGLLTSIYIFIYFTLLLHKSFI